MTEYVGMVLHHLTLGKNNGWRKTFFPSRQISITLTGLYHLTSPLNLYSHDMVGATISDKLIFEIMSWLPVKSLL